MSEEKQIEEMTRTIYKNCDVTRDCAKIIASVLIGKGYSR